MPWHDRYRRNGSCFGQRAKEIAVALRNAAARTEGVRH